MSTSARTRRLGNGLSQEDALGQLKFGDGSRGAVDELALRKLGPLLEDDGGPDLFAVLVVRHAERDGLTDAVDERLSATL